MDTAASHTFFPVTLDSSAYPLFSICSNAFAIPESSNATACRRFKFFPVFLVSATSAFFKLPDTVDPDRSGAVGRTSSAVHEADAACRTELGWISPP